MLPVNERAARFAANVRAWFAYHGFPEPALFDVLEDRCCLEWSPELEARITASVGSVLDPWQLKIKAHKPLGVESAVEGWRERVATYAVQIIKHVFEGRTFYEIDWDPRNPNWGLALLIGHGIDFLRWKLRGWKVDPFQVEKVLRKRGVA